MSITFKVGDLVKLNGQQVAMTVIHVADTCIRCQWFDFRLQLQQGDFDQRVLQRLTQ